MRPPEDATTTCVDELGPVSPCTYPPAPGPGRRMNTASLGALGIRPWTREGLGLRCFAGARRQGSHAHRLLAQYQRLPAVAEVNPAGDLYLITDNLSSHKSPPIRRCLEKHPRVKQISIPVGARWLNLQEPWWRLFRREVLAGQSSSLTRRRSNQPRESPPSNSTAGPNLGGMGSSSETTAASSRIFFYSL
jgi:hypothetical protein